MALHLNLCHEIQSAELARRRDPLKLGLYFLIFLAVLFVGYYVMRLGKAHSVASQRDALAAEWRTLEPQQTEAAARAAELSGQIALSQGLVNHIEGRFYWAPVLERIGGLVPHYVQLDRLSGDRRTEGECQLTIEGSAGGEEPRKIAEELRTTLAAKFAEHYKDVSASFVSLDDGTETVTLEGADWPTAVFAIRLTLRMKKSETPADDGLADASEPAQAK